MPGEVVGLDQFGTLVRDSNIPAHIAHTGFHRRKREYQFFGLLPAGDGIVFKNRPCDGVGIKDVAVFVGAGFADASFFRTGL